MTKVFVWQPYFSFLFLNHVHLIASLALHISINPSLKTELDKSQQALKDLSQNKTTESMTKAIKKVFICDRLFANHELDSNQQTGLWMHVSRGIDEKNMSNAVNYCKENGIASTESKGLLCRMYSSRISGLWKFLHSEQSAGPVKDAADAVGGLTASDFLREIDAIVEQWPVLTDSAREALRIIQGHYSEKFNDTIKSLPQRLTRIHKKFLEDRVRKDCAFRLEKARMEALGLLFSDLEEHYAYDQDSWWVYCSHSRLYSLDLFYSRMTLVLEELQVEAQARSFYECHKFSYLSTSETSCPYYLIASMLMYVRYK